MPDEADRQLHPVVRRFVEEAGNTTQSFGVGRVLGQIYACLYFSTGPRNLDDLQHLLGISKGSASTGVRQLEQWNAVRRIWIRGDRKDYYEANDWFGRIIKNILSDVMTKRLSASTSLLEGLEQELDEETTDAEHSFLRDRIRRLREFRDKTHSVWSSPIVTMLFK